MIGIDKISVVFPTLNEEKNISSTINKAIGFLNRKFKWWEIIVVDNASTDNTLAIVGSLMKKKSMIRLVRHPKNLGYAKSTSDGLKHAKGDVIFIIDSDGQHDIREIGKFMEKIRHGYDLVIGWKKVRHDPLPRIIMARFYNFLFRILFGTCLHDVDCGFKAYTKRLAKKLTVEYNNVPVGAEISAKTQRMGFKIAELEIRHFSRKEGKSSFKPLKMPFVIARIFLSLFILRARIGKANKMHK